MPRPMPKLRWILCAAVSGLLVNGCATQPPKQNAALNTPASKPQHVDFANLTARTSSVDAGASVTPDELLARVAAMSKEENAPARIRRLVRRFPDASLEVVRDTTAAQASNPERTAVAAAYDQTFNIPADSGWSCTLAQAVADPAGYDAIHNARALAMQLIEMGRPEQVAAQTAVPAGTNFVFARAELMRARGIAALLSDHPADARQLWQSAEILVRSDRSVGAELCLLEAAAIRDSGAVAESNQRWSAAATAAVGVADPTLWERIIDARDDTTAWPTGVGDTVPVDAGLWRQIGDWRFARGESAGALLAFKQAESLFTLPRDRAEARIAEARVLLTINQSGAASSILSTLTTDADPQVSHHALAVLGDARRELDDLPGALHLLQAAVADDDQFPAAMRAPARADLGLVFLLSAREKDGLDWLHKAQADFEAAHDDAGLVQSLRNEAAYFEQNGRADEARALRERAAKISAS